jgi:hypothetical protein
MSTPVTFQPALYYAVTVRDNNEACRNYEQTFEVAEFYSNDGVHCYVTCGICRQRMEILTAVLLDPQPEVS